MNEITDLFDLPENADRLKKAQDQGMMVVVELGVACSMTCISLYYTLGCDDMINYVLFIIFGALFVD